MGKVIRIEDDSIRSMRKTLDDLPDKRLGKTRDEAAEMLFEHLKKAMEKGYSFKELADILEVVYALADLTGSREALLAAYQQKHDARGGFEKRIFLISKE